MIDLVQFVKPVIFPLLFLKIECCLGLFKIIVIKPSMTITKHILSNMPEILCAIRNRIIGSNWSIVILPTLWHMCHVFRVE